MALLAGGCAVERLRPYPGRSKHVGHVVRERDGRDEHNGRAVLSVCLVGGEHVSWRGRLLERGPERVGLIVAAGLGDVVEIDGL